MCDLSEKTKNIIARNIKELLPIFILSLPLLIALYFGHNNVYKVLFLLLIGYIILFILLLANTVDVFMYNVNISFKRDGILYNKNAYTVGFLDRDLKKITANEIERCNIELNNGRVIDLPKDEVLAMAKIGNHLLGKTKMSSFANTKDIETVDDGEIEKKEKELQTLLNRKDIKLMPQ